MEKNEKIRRVETMIKKPRKFPHRGCHAIGVNGERCGMPALKGKKFCFAHEPSIKEERDKARHLAGLRRRREKVTSDVYEWTGLNDLAGIRRIIEIAVHDALALDNSGERCRLLGYLAGLGLRALEVEHECQTSKVLVAEIGIGAGAENAEDIQKRAENIIRLYRTTFQRGLEIGSGDSDQKPN